MKRNFDKTCESEKDRLPEDMENSNDIEKYLLDQFRKLRIGEKKNIIAALLMFLSAREEGVFDHLLTHEQD